MLVFLGGGAHGACGLSLLRLGRVLGVLGPLLLVHLARAL